MCFNYYWEILEKKREHRENTQLGFCWTRIQTPILWLHMPRTEILQVQGSYYPLPARCSSWYTVKSKEYWFWREIWIIILAFFFFLQPLGCAPNPEAAPGPPGRRPPNAPHHNSSLPSPPSAGQPGKPWWENLSTPVRISQSSLENGRNTHLLELWGLNAITM